VYGYCVGSWRWPTMRVWYVLEASECSTMVGVCRVQTLDYPAFPRRVRRAGIVKEALLVECVVLGSAQEVVVHLSTKSQLHG